MNACRARLDATASLRKLRQSSRCSQLLMCTVVRSSSAISISKLRSPASTTSLRQRRGAAPERKLLIPSQLPRETFLFAATSGCTQKGFLGAHFLGVPLPAFDSGEAASQAVFPREPCAVGWLSPAAFPAEDTEVGVDTSAFFQDDTPSEGQEGSLGTSVLSSRSSWGRWGVAGPVDGCCMAGSSSASSCPPSSSTAAGVCREAEPSR
mmetsp:Transcript_45471/g.108099  ORF Transcript_45471/g.108099 Transcript_45471/m.108099 type:complete len:208 (-) Transcript_45471:146-769(-)